jgi:hypothetical protein
MSRKQNVMTAIGALSSHQEATLNLPGLKASNEQISAELSKEPNGESLKDTTWPRC